MSFLKAIHQMGGPSETRQKILIAAKMLFVEKGYSSSTIRDIADHAGVNSALIQHYFGGKQGLLIEIAKELLDTELQRISDFIDLAVSNTEELRARLHLFLEMLLVRGIEKWDAIQIVMHEVYELSSVKSLDFPNLTYEFVKRLAHFLKQAQKAGIISKKRDATLIADQFLCLALDQVKNWKVNRRAIGFDISNKKQRAQWIRATLDVYFEGIVR